MGTESNLIIEIKDEAQEFEDNQGTPTLSNPVSHLGVLFIATAGQNGPNLGCDEEEIVLLVLSILKVSTNEVIDTKSFVVQPHTSDINENLLSEECKVDFKLCEDQVKNAKILDVVIQQIDDVISSTVGSDDVFVLVVDGQLPLRQCLHPETSAKEINLPEYYNTFFDLRKEFFMACHYVPESIDEMLKHLNLLVPEESTQDGTNGKVNEMTLIVQHLLSIGHVFDRPELIQMKLEPGLCSKNEEVDGQTVVRARGLPWQSSDADIAKFFRGLNIAKGGVALCLSPQGRRNGEALIRFESQEQRDMALRRHKHHIGARYIEVYKATGEDFIAVAGGSNNEAQAFLIKGGQVIIRMRGLPYDCTAKQVLEFFDSGDNACQVMDEEEGVLFVRRPDGRATGDAFVLFAEEPDAGKALSKHRESIGSRYIELFRSTTAEVQQVLNRCLEATKSAEVSPQLPLATPTGQSSSSVAQVPPVTVSIMPQHMITAGTRKDCVRLRGLPYEAQVEHILDFLGDHAKNIVYQGVHMVYNAQGQPSGEAFIQMDSEHSAFLAAQAKHHRYMISFKKQRYIEVFQCSGEDMNMVLTGGIPLSPQKALVSPGMLSPPPEVGGSSLVPLGAHSLSPPLHRQIRSPQAMPLSAAAIAASMRSLAYAQSQVYLPHLGQQGLLGTSPGPALPHGLIGSHPYFQQPTQFPHNLIRISHLSPPLQEEVPHSLNRFSLINPNPQLMFPSPQQLLLSSLMAQSGGASALSHLIGATNCSNIPTQNNSGKRSFDEAFPGYESGILAAKRWQQASAAANAASNIYPPQNFSYKKE